MCVTYHCWCRLPTNYVKVLCIWCECFLVLLSIILPIKWNLITIKHIFGCSWHSSYRKYGVSGGMIQSFKMMCTFTVSELRMTEHIEHQNHQWHKLWEEKSTVPKNLKNQMTVRYEVYDQHEMPHDTTIIHLICNIYISYIIQFHRHCSH